MAGYTPVFDSVFDGTLCGKWPESAVWLTLLALCDARGNVDMTPAAIVARTGWPLDLLRQGIKTLCEPDEDSRTQVLEGRRLVPIDEGRSWGWHVVNFEHYREKARLMAKNAREVEAGREAERKRLSRAMSAGVRRESPESAGVPLSKTETETKTNTEQEGAPLVVGLNSEAWERWEKYRLEIKKPIRKPSRAAAMQSLASFGDQQSAVVRNSIANGYQGLFAPKDNGSHREALAGKTSDQLEAEYRAKGLDPWELKP